MIDKYKQAFQEEAREILVELEAALLALNESRGDTELVGRAFRALHTIKGSGAMFGFDQLAAFTHNLENAFDEVRNGRLAITSELIDLSLRALDQIKTMLEDSDGRGSDETTAHEILAKLRVLTGKEEQEKRGERGKEEKAEKQSPPAEVAATAVPAPPRRQARLAYSLLSRSRSAAHWRQSTFALAEIEADGQPSGLGRYGRPSAPGRPRSRALLYRLGHGADDRRRAAGDFRCLHFCRRCVRAVNRTGMVPASAFVAPDPSLAESSVGSSSVNSSVAGGSSPEASSGAVATAAEAAKPKYPSYGRRSYDTPDNASSIRVPADKLDLLVNLVGELVTVQARLAELAARREDPDVSAVSEEIDRLTSALRENSMNIRMLPIRGTFERFRRLVHDLARDLHKEVEFMIEGAETELDKTVIDQLGDPLLHLIRNSMDHGIELPEKRTVAGKRSTATLHLSARHSGANVLICVADDGAGIDAQAVRDRAVERGLVAPEAQLTESEIFSLILSPGFSTAKQVTDVSGRGVGMDVVRRNIEALRGAIESPASRARAPTSPCGCPLPWRSSTDCWCEWAMPISYCRWPPPWNVSS